MLQGSKNIRFHYDFHDPMMHFYARQCSISNVIEPSFLQLVTQNKKYHIYGSCVHKNKGHRPQ